MTMRDFIAKIDDYNARLAAAERTLSALAVEKDILREQAGDYMRVSQFDDEIGRVSFKFTFPPNYQPPASAPVEQQGGTTIVRHGEQAVE